MITVELAVDPVRALDAAAGALLAGEVVAIPTDTVYGLAALASDAQAVDRLFDIKRRPPERHVAVLVADRTAAATLTDDPDAALDKLMRALWPGPLTVVLPAAGGSVGVRQPDHPWVLELLAMTGPLSTTSANVHGEPPLQTAADIAGRLGGQLAVVVDGGPCGGEASTVVASGPDGLTILREGVVDAETIRGLAGLPRPSS